MTALVIFEGERRAVRLDEIVLIEAIPPEQPLPGNRFAERHPSEAQTRVHTRSAGFFYTAETWVDVLERMQLAGQIGAGRG